MHVCVPSVELQLVQLYVGYPFEIGPTPSYIRHVHMHGDAWQGTMQWTLAFSLWLMTHTYSMAV